MKSHLHSAMIENRESSIQHRVSRCDGALAAVVTSARYSQPRPMPKMMTANASTAQIDPTVISFARMVFMSKTQ